MGISGVLFGYRVESELPLPRLRPGVPTRGTIVIRRARGRLDRCTAGEIARVDYPDGRPLFTVVREGNRLRLWCALSGGYRLDPANGLIETDSKSGEGWWQDRITNAVVPALLSARGELVLHAAAAAGPRGALVVCATSGRGKSTLADAFGRLGAPVLAEDGVAISCDGGHVVAWPGPVGVRLRATGSLPEDPKSVHLHDHLHDRPSLGGDPLPVATVALLDARGGTEVSTLPLSAEAALPPLLSHSFAAGDDHRQGRFSLLATLLRQAPAKKVRLPDDLVEIDRHAATLWDQLAEHGPRIPDELHGNTGLG